MALTEAQRTTLATHIRANTDPGVVAALAIRNDNGIAEIYNLDGTEQVYRIIEPDEYRAALDFTETEGMDAAKMTSFDWMSGGLREPIDANEQKIRDGILALFPQNGAGATPNTRAALIALETRVASVFEEIYLTGPGPTSLVVEGPVTRNDVGQALNENP